jgi:hypothetical protein
VIVSIGIVCAFVAGAVVMFGLAVRLGMLVGMRLDRALEARAATDGAALSGLLNPNPDVINGPEENRGE